MSGTLKDAPVEISNPLLLPRIEKKAPRAYLVGMTDSGKSTLMQVLMENYQKAYSTKTLPVRTLIVDTKPRFKAEYELNGLKTSETGRYRRWDIEGSGVIPGSYVLPRRASIKGELDQVWALGGVTAIVQSEEKTQWPELIEYVKAFYEKYGARYPRLIVVDELADFFERRVLTDIFQRVARNGRERDCCLIAGSQRPRKVPVETMTEMLRLYLFELDFIDDMKHIVEFGIPKWLTLEDMKPTGHSFFMWDRKLKHKEPSGMFYELAI